MTVAVSLKELVERLSHLKDDDTFRWFQDSAPSPSGDGSIVALETYRVTMGQARYELGIKTKKENS